MAVQARAQLRRRDQLGALPAIPGLGLKSRDLIGYTAVQFFIHLPVMLILAALLMTTFTY
ncbi:hypothetical protein ACRAWG_28330 [Methylobacterium sp. P31]